MPIYSRNEFDVTDSVNTTDYDQVAAEIWRIYADLYRHDTHVALDSVFADVVGLYRGERPAYRACDTDYRDISLMRRCMPETLTVAGSAA